MTYKFPKGHAMNDQNASATKVQHVMPHVAARNSKLNRITRGLLASLGLTAFVLLSAPAQAQVAPPLGVAQQFGALGNSGVTGSTGTGTQVSGDVGSSPTATITNFPPSSTIPPYIVHLANDAVVQQARADAIAAFSALNQGPGTALANDLSTVGALTPGIYSVGAADLPAGTTLTLNDPTGTGVFIFNVGSSLTANIGSSVIGTANPCNIYWQVGTSATLNGTTFRGTVIADASITVGAGSNLTGRALAGTGATGAVTMAGAGGNTIGGCSFNAPLVTGPVAPTVSKSFSPASISAGGVSTLTITLSNSSVDTADTITSLTDNLPGGMVIAATPNASTTCGSTVTAPAGGSTVTLTGGTIPVASLNPASTGTCAVSVNVTAASAGSLTNTVAAGGLVTNNGNNAAPASAVLTVTSLVATSIPTLSEWAMIMLVALLAMTGFVAMRRQSR
ncbi:MAG: IPTL-CTERM sorting domain-containing protein [Thiobacillus sp.]|nr:IPTL-CTERM sorting domain-containing protein [Thiobacillus sp.]